MAMGDLDRIGLVAVRQEILPLLGILQREGQERYGEAILHLGSIEGRPVALALAVEMETAAVAQTAAAHKLPWVAVRAISDAADDDLVLDFSRLQLYLDKERPAWQQQASRWFYLLTHPTARQRLRRLRRGLALASGQASRLVEAMIQIRNHP